MMSSETNRWDHQSTSPRRTRVDQHTGKSCTLAGQKSSVHTLHGHTMDERDRRAGSSGSNDEMTINNAYGSGTALYSIMEHDGTTLPLTQVPSQRRVTSLQPQRSINVGPVVPLKSRHYRQCFSLDETVLQQLHQKRTSQATSEG